jgi:AAA+ superfamily predicted ATPase
MEETLENKTLQIKFDCLICNVEHTGIYNFDILNTDELKCPLCNGNDRKNLKIKKIKEKVTKNKKDDIKSLVKYLEEKEKEPIPNVSLEYDVKGMIDEKIRMKRGTIHQFEILNKLIEDKVKPKTFTLFDGEAGLGKTFFAVASANEIKKIMGDNVIIIYLKAQELMFSSVGGSDIIEKIFDHYIRTRTKPILIIIDEIEILFLKKGEKGVMALERVSSLVGQIDGYKEKNSYPTYHFFGCSNKKMMMDETARSRMDIYDFDYPSDEVLMEIWHQYTDVILLDKKFDNNVMLEIIRGCTPRDISNMIASELYTERDVLKIEGKEIDLEIVKRIVNYHKNNDEKLNHMKDFFNEKLNLGSYKITTLDLYKSYESSNIYKDKGLSFNEFSKDWSSYVKKEFGENKKVTKETFNIKNVRSVGYRGIGIKEKFIIIEEGVKKIMVEFECDKCNEKIIKEGTDLEKAKHLNSEHKDCGGILKFIRLIEPSSNPQILINTSKVSIDVKDKESNDFEVKIIFSDKPNIIYQESDIDSKW